MKIRQIKFKIIILLLGVCVIFCLLLALFSPYQSRQLGNNILVKEAEFIAYLLAENLGLGMEAMVIDEGASLDKTLKMIDDIETEKEQETITGISVFDMEMSFIKGMNTTEGTVSKHEPVKSIVFEDHDDTLGIWAPIHSADRSVLGYVRIDFSKQLLNERLAVNASHALLLGLLVFVGVLLIVYYLVTKLIDVPISKVVERMNYVVKQSDLTREVDINSSDEIGELSQYFNKMIQFMNSIVAQVQKSGIQVTASSTQIAASARQLEATVSEQAASTNEVVATTKEISATSQDLVKTMNDVNSLALETATLAEKGRIELSDMEKSIGQLNSASSSVVSKLSLIREKANNIDNVITTINKVADQTDLLSLNAAIEAEKAGEYGLGFSVVAREIRRLADQTAVSTLDIEHMVKEMQSAVSSGVMEMDKFTEEVKQAVENIGTLSHQLEQIIDRVQSVTVRFESVNEGMQSQSQGALQISESMVQLNEAIHQTSESLREFNSVTEQLNNAARGLQNEISQFKVVE